MKKINKYLKGREGWEQMRMLMDWMSLTGRVRGHGGANGQYGKRPGDGQRGELGNSQLRGSGVW